MIFSQFYGMIGIQRKEKNSYQPQPLASWRGSLPSQVLDYNFAFASRTLILLLPVAFINLQNEWFDKV
jgi:hypothetical protein